MKIEIQPTEYNMPSGIHVAQIADINIVSDNMKDAAVFSVQLQTKDEVNIDEQLRVQMSDEVYLGWDNTNEFAIKFILKTLNLQRA
jgi:hypothetical protein